MNNNNNIKFILLLLITYLLVSYLCSGVLPNSHEYIHTLFTNKISMTISIAKPSDGMIVVPSCIISSKMFDKCRRVNIYRLQCTIDNHQLVHVEHLPKRVSKLA